MTLPLQLICNHRTSLRLNRLPQCSANRQRMRYALKTLLGVTVQPDVSRFVVLRQVFGPAGPVPNRNSRFTGNRHAAGTDIPGSIGPGNDADVPPDRLSGTLNPFGLYLVSFTIGQYPLVFEVACVITQQYGFTPLAKKQTPQSLRLGINNVAFRQSLAQDPGAAHAGKEQQGT